MTDMVGMRPMSRDEPHGPDEPYDQDGWCDRDEPYDLDGWCDQDGPVFQFATQNATRQPQPLRSAIWFNENILQPALCFDLTVFSFFDFVEPALVLARYPVELLLVLRRGYLCRDGSRCTYHAS